MLKQLHRRLLSESHWYDIDIGKHIVSHCEKCQCQRVQYCIAKIWDQEKKDWLFTFECSGCKEVENAR